jgi:DNA polymerase-3 subunit delta
MNSRTDAGPLNLIYGDDPLLVEEVLKEFLRTLAADIDLSFALDTFEAGEHPTRSVLEAAENLPFGSLRRAVLVRHAERWREADFRLLKEYASDPVLTTVLILHAVGLDKRSKLLSTIPRDKQVAASLPRGRRRGWLRGRFEQRGFELTDQALELVLERGGNTLSDLDSTAQKICLYYGSPRRLQPEDLAPLLSGVPDANIWQLLDLISERSLGGTLKLLRRVMAGAEGEGPHVFNMLARHFRNLLALQSARAAGVPVRQVQETLGIKDLELQRLSQASKRFTESELTRAVALLHEADLAMKTSRYHDPDIALEMLVARLVL